MVYFGIIYCIIDSAACQTIVLYLTTKKNTGSDASGVCILFLAKEAAQSFFAQCFQFVFQHIIQIVQLHLFLDGIH